MNIELNHINCFYGKHQALNDISLCYPLGETIVLLGQSGAGKSSLLKVFNLLEIPTSGQMTIANAHFDFSEKISESTIRLLRKNVGMVFQNYNLWPHLTVLENLIEAPCHVLKLSKKEASDKAIAILKRLQIDDMAERYPLHLSGGQQQRVAIARALMMEPQILLFDEPTAALDPAITSQVAEIINELSQTGITQIIVTHEVDFARKVASQVIYMEQGKIIEQGQLECFAHPKSEEFKAYLSH
ncbi:arginine ABC transporter ATP-binding protein ArtP [Gilliamella sp. App2-1]|uniref:arginine ABC transporter ATP-binding protein ArtP n=1 Tax=Gilliamella sp. App2-1 TaxID=3120230 RepID=UPI0008280C2D|nr:arginine ABC transporter ATP-binding protein ArtP [Gilliamella apicola]OCG20242.1 arginine ABC transporter ATP-binding protein ArtP [Gilliamella apicola]